jgi:hypothetical protein
MKYSRGGPHCKIFLKKERLYRKPPKGGETTEEKKTQGGQQKTKLR